MHRVKELDSLRGLAALAIVIFHLWFDRLGILGSAVDLFFVLSGYLITTIILKNALSDRFLIAFYLRRGLRIWPIYYLALIALVILYPLLPTAETLSELPYYLTFTQEIPRYRPASFPTFPSALRHTWSLAIEEQFYLIWPPLLWWLGKKRLPIVAMSLVGVAVAARVAELSSFILITHCDGLALGGLLAGLLAKQKHVDDAPLRVHRYLMATGTVAAAFLGVIVTLGLVSPSGAATMIPAVVVSGIKPLVLNLIFFALVGLTVLHAGDSGLSWLRGRWLVYLGTISYGIYLYHHFIFEICKLYERHYGWGSSLLMDFAKLAASLALAALSWKYVEQPILALKRRLGYDAGSGSGMKQVHPNVEDLQGVQAS
jgi:peptidoglycan/LPS O-acetylase OafA/YrhL